MALTIRAATGDDLDAILAIYNEAVATTTATLDTEPRSREKQAAWLAAHDGNPYPALVAVDPATGAVLGWASLSSYNPRAGYRTTAENSIYVGATARGKGVGRALLSALLTEATQRGFVTIIALISADNIASLRLHEQHGFTLVGTLTQVGRKFDRWVDVTLMQKHLSPVG